MRAFKMIRLVGLLAVLLPGLAVAQFDDTAPSNCSGNGANTVCAPLIGNVTAADQNLSLDQRPPAQTDDSGHDYANPSSFWSWHQPNGTGLVYQQLVNNANYPAWQPVNLNQNPLPGDATSQAPSVVYWTKQAISSYTGPLLHVTFTDTTGLAVQQISGGKPDLATLWAYTVFHGGPARVDTWYDESGNGYDCVPPSAANQPMLQIDRDGDLVVVWDRWTLSAGVPTSNRRYCLISTGYTVALNAHTSFAVETAQNFSGDTAGINIFAIGQPSGTVAKQFLQSYLGGVYVPGYATNYGGWISAEPSLAYLSVTPTAIAWQAGAFAGASFSATTASTSISGGVLGMMPSNSFGGSATNLGYSQYGFISFAPTLSAANILAEKIAIHGMGKTTPQARCNIVTVGESVMEGIDAPGEQGWVAQLANLLPKSVRVFNYGWTGTGLGVTGTTNVNILQTYAYKIANSADRCNILILNGGNTNDYYVTSGNPPQSVATEQGYIDTMVAFALANNFTKVFVLTPIDRSGGSAAFYTMLSAMTPSIVTQAAIDGYTPIRLDQDPSLGTVNSSNINTAIFVQGTHLTAEGAAIEANDIKNAIAPFIRPGG